MEKTEQNFKISIITPFFNESQNNSISNYFEEVLENLKPITDNFEIICIDDGSKDDTLNDLIKYHKSDSRIKVIGLSRNFGKEAALTAGLDHSTGDCVIIIDADLQDPPSEFQAMVEKWKKGYNIVLMRRRTRNDSFGKKLGAGFFYFIMNKLSGRSIPKNIGDFRLMDKKAVSAVKSMKENGRFMRGILSWVGFKTVMLEYDRPKRFDGERTYSLSKSIRLAINGILSFSVVPIRIWTFIGMLISCLSFLYACLIIIKKIFFGIGVPGYASLIIIVLFLGGIQLITLGVLGEYIGKIFDEVKKRPLYIIEKKLD